MNVTSLLKTPKTALAVALLAVFLASGVARAEGRRAFGPAESLTFEAAYLGLPVGRIHVVVGADTRIDGQRVWPVMAIAKTDPLFMLYPVKDKYITWWSPDSRLTLGNELLADEKNVHRRERVRFDRGGGRALTRREEDGRNRLDRVYQVPEGSMDILAALYSVRGHRLEVGDHVELPIFTGRKVFTLKIDVEGKETIETKAGRFQTKALRVAVAFSGSLASKRDLRVYVTDDQRHMPVRIDAEFLLGTLAADLVSFQTGISY
jgi:hypothetical protein